MNRLEGITKRIELESVLISTHRYHAPLNYIDYNRYISTVNKLAKVFGLDTDGSIYMGDEMKSGRLMSKWCIIIKGYENTVNEFLKEVKKVTE